MGVETILRASRFEAAPAMTDNSQLSLSLPCVSRKKVTAAFDGGRLSSDSGVMLLALADRRRNVADTLAAHIADRRDPSRITDTVADVLRAVGCGGPQVISRSVGAFSQREIVGCEHRSRPMSGSRPHASLKAASRRSQSKSLPSE